MRAICLWMTLPLSLLFFSCARRAEFYAYSYKGDKVTIRRGEKDILSFTVGGTPDSNGLCRESRYLAVPAKGADLVCNVRVDSGNHRVVDTTITISGDNEQPFLWIGVTDGRHVELRDWSMNIEM